MSSPNFVRTYFVLLMITGTFLASAAGQAVSTKSQAVSRIVDVIDGCF